LSLAKSTRDGDAVSRRNFSMWLCALAIYINFTALTGLLRRRPCFEEAGDIQPNIEAKASGRRLDACGHGLR
tara:strand:+ start:569 stop:784 length:216 start_codon:yes stop_codon:yes gene_type:complete